MNNIAFVYLVRDKRYAGDFLMGTKSNFDIFCIECFEIKSFLIYRVADFNEYDFCILISIRVMRMINDTRI